MKRRSFNKVMAAASVATMFRNGWSDILFKKAATPQLPDVAMNGNSVEICTNSRYSFHSGYTSVPDNQVIANVLWAAASAPLLANKRTIYLAMQDNVYKYEFIDGKHVLEVHVSGDKRSEKNASFEIGVSTDPSGATEDAGVALHWAQLASVAFWKTKADQPASCPKDTGRTNANKTWNPASVVHCVNCYGQSSSVNGLVKTLSAVSSDKTLPDPLTDGTVSLEDAMKSPLFGTDFSSNNISSEQISQILWASYGCTAHKVTGTSNIALSVASYMGDYYLSGRIYLVTANGVQRYHIRKGTDAKTADHRLERLTSIDCRAHLRLAHSGLPKNAPVYIVYCGQQNDYQQLLEAGYCGGAALLQSTALGLQGHYVAQFSAAERSAIQDACGINSANVPMLVFSVGHAGPARISHTEKSAGHSKIGIRASSDAFTGRTTFIIDNAESDAEITISSLSGKRIRKLDKSIDGSRFVHWDGTDSSGKSVKPGFYCCKVVSHGFEASVVIRKM